MKLNLSGLPHRISTPRYGDRLRPYRDWACMLATGGLLLVLSLGWSYFVFLRMSAGANLEGAPSAGSLVNTASIETLQAMFESRAAEQAHFRTDYRFVDPSR